MKIDVTCPEYLRGFLTYMQTIKGKSKKTVDEYYLDVRLFLRYIIFLKQQLPDDTDLASLDIGVCSRDMLCSITLSDIYDFLNYLGTKRKKNASKCNNGNIYGVSSATIARKISSLRTFFKYLTTKVYLLEVDPTKDLEIPKKKKSLPRHLSVDEAINLLSIIDGQFKERDYCILTLFLNCGLRVSELVGINLQDIKEDTLIVTGKGNKERKIYLNQACLAALQDYLPNRFPCEKDKNALFTTRQNSRISTRTVKWMVEKYITRAGLDPARYSTHKLRHTAATLMYQNGVDVLVLQNILGHENLDTTKIYTHINNEMAKDAIDRNPLNRVVKPTKKSD